VCSIDGQVDGRVVIGRYDGCTCEGGGGALKSIIVHPLCLAFNYSPCLRINPYPARMMKLCGKGLEKTMQTVRNMELNPIIIHVVYGRLVSYLFLLYFFYVSRMDLDFLRQC